MPDTLSPRARSRTARARAATHNPVRPVRSHRWSALRSPRVSRSGPARRPPFFMRCRVSHGWATLGSNFRDTALGGVSRGDREKAEGAARAGERSQETAGAQNKTQAPVTKAPPPLPAAVQPVAQVTTVPAAPPLVSRPSWLSDFKLGGYGSTRFEANDLNKFSDTFTYLTELEVERRQPVEGGLRGFSQSIE